MGLIAVLYLYNAWNSSLALRAVCADAIVSKNVQSRLNDAKESIHVTEPPHDKTIKMTVRPAKTQISLGIRPVWLESSLRLVDS